MPRSRSELDDAILVIRCLTRQFDPLGDIVHVGQIAVLQLARTGRPDPGENPADFIEDQTLATQLVDEGLNAPNQLIGRQSEPIGPGPHKGTGLLKT